MSRPALARDRDQLLFAESVAQVLAPIGRSVREHDDQPPTRSDVAPGWEALCRDLDPVGLPLPAAVGGADARWFDVGIVVEGAGHELLALPYLSTMIAMRLLTRFDDPAVADVLQAAARGSAPPVLAVPASSCVESYRPTLVVDDGTVTGVVPDVLDATLAGHLVCPARTDDGTDVLAVVAASSVRFHASRLIDLSRGVAQVQFDRVPALRVIGGSAVSRTVADTLTFAAAGVALESIGGAARCIEQTVDYAKIREQFGAPVGRQQAVKHALADVVRSVEPARAAAYAALAAFDDDAADLTALREAAALAKTTAVASYLAAAGAAIQLHGAIGFTWEHEPHRHLKRAVSAQALFGSDAEHRRVLAGRLLRDLAHRIGATP